ncbi:cysteine hydrolase family protein [Bordetella sp. FB-8]|uniref:cysteine hydrolase family protein n=1 Tax=Bordetella sp. FB-8 TaxID=1159870 RepID=UPI00036B5E04|nr:isochorismatase family protein [Bordetella sp. FB-8]
MKQAVIAIDIQESFRQLPFWSDANLPAFVRATQGLLDTAAARGIPILQVFHIHGPEKPASVFSRDSGHVKTLAELKMPQPADVFYKKVHSSFYGLDDAGTSLQTWLREHGIEEVIICGIRTEQCCETTARHASDDGFKVKYAMDATLTFAMTSPSGRVYTPQEIKDHTELVLVNRFARILPAAQALAD